LSITTSELNNICFLTDRFPLSK